MFVKPTHAGVPDPQHGGYLPPEGRHVEPGPYWWRRVADGDVTEATPPDPEPAAAPADLATQSPPTAGSSVSETTKTASRRKGAQP